MRVNLLQALRLAAWDGMDAVFRFNGGFLEMRRGRVARVSYKGSEGQEAFNRLLMDGVLEGTDFSAQVLEGSPEEGPEGEDLEVMLLAAYVAADEASESCQTCRNGRVNLHSEVELENAEFLKELVDKLEKVIKGIVGFGVILEGVCLWAQRGGEKWSVVVAPAGKGLGYAELKAKNLLKEV